MRASRTASPSLRAWTRARQPGGDHRTQAATGEVKAVRLMLAIWMGLIWGGLGYFIVIGLTHH
jgi:hypothetical protein